MRLLEYGLRLMERHLTVVLLGILTLTVIAGSLASNLHVDTDLSRLLPESSRTVHGLRALEEKWGSEARVSIILRGAEAAQLERAVDELAGVLDRHEDVERVEARRPVEFLRQNRLLYLERSDLETVADRLEKRVRWEKARANPLFVAVDDEKPPAVDFDDIASKYPDSDSPGVFL